MSNQARASRHASGILPSKQFFAPRKPITQNASRRKSTTLSVIVNPSSTPPLPVFQTATSTTTTPTKAPFSALNSPVINIQEEEVSLLQQPLNVFSTVTTSLPSDPTNSTLDQSFNTIYSSGEPQGISVRNSPIRPLSSVPIRYQQNQQDENEDFTHSPITSVLEPISPAAILEPSSYRQIRHGSGSNLLSRDFSTAPAFSRHSDSDSSGTLSTQIQMMPPKKLTPTKPSINTSPYASIAKSMPRIIYKPNPISHTDSKGRKRLYQVWPGRNRFFFGGRIMTSRDFPAFLVAFSALVVPSGLFLAFTCPYLYKNISPAVVFVFAYLFLLAITSMLRTSWSDPGIIPRNLDPSPPTEDLEDPENNAQNNSNSPYYPMRSVPLPKEVNINGQTIRLKYCETCRIYRPPRCSHCRQCDNCVENEDHHCIWLNNCIGRRNYRTFFTFIATATILCIYVLGFCLVHIFLLMKDFELNFISAITFAPVSFVLAVLSFFLMWSVGGLTMYHMYLVSKNLTTHEQIRIPMPRRNGIRNPFDYRNISRNCMWVLCRPLTRSSVSRRAYVEDENLHVGQGEGVSNVSNQQESQPTNIINNTEQNTNDTEPNISETHQHE